jgi:predicted metal-dependent phosphoesterase TrpH
MLMSLPMIKYLVMGFKKLITKSRCKLCKKVLPVPMWEICDNCNPKSFRNIHLRKQVRLEKARLQQIQSEKALKKDPTIYKYKNYAQIPNEIAIKASILIYDDVTGHIIGYKM